MIGATLVTRRYVGSANGSQTSYCPAPWPDFQTLRNVSVVARACPLGRSHRQHHVRHCAAAGWEKDQGK